MKIKLVYTLVVLFICSYLLSGCRENSFVDVSTSDQYSSLIGQAFSIRSRTLVQAFDEVASTAKITDEEKQSVARLLTFPGLKNRYLKWTVEVPIGEKFKIVKIIKTEAGGGYRIYYQVEFEKFEQLEEAIVLLRVPRAQDIDKNGNSGLSLKYYQKIK